VKPEQANPAGHPASNAPVLNVPNVLTLLRLLCVPLMIVFLFSGGGGAGLARDSAALVFVLASITDLIDGAVARKFGQETNFGKLADPLADKALIGSALIGLSILGDLPWWVTIVILVREISVSLLRIWVIEHGVIPASRGGKLKTVVQTVAITMALVVVPGLPWWGAVTSLVMGAAVALTVATGIDYLVRALRLRSEAPGIIADDGAVR
jgi:CDP-diacylglycerol--glycerol-3-phosphate 3-phosphatidyltransferase